MQHELAVMNRSGDAKTFWNLEDPDSVAAAKAVFDKVRAEGHAVYKVSQEGNEIVREFDPNVEKMISVPALSGG